MLLFFLGHLLPSDTPKEMLTKYILAILSH